MQTHPIEKSIHKYCDIVYFPIQKKYICVDDDMDVTEYFFHKGNPPPNITGGPETDPSTLPFTVPFFAFELKSL